MGLTLFNTFISEQDEGLGRLMADAKMTGRVSTLGRSIAMQRNFSKPEGWTDKKHMKFNKDKCQVLPWGWKCPLQQYNLRTDCLGS